MERINSTTETLLLEHRPAPSTANPTEPWRWVPTLYFAQGIPYVAAMGLSVVMYKNLNLSNTQIALYTSWLYLPWVIKPLWAPLVEIWGSKRSWIVGMQGVVGLAFAAVALAIPANGFFRLTLAIFWLIAFAAATHDVAADGFYMLVLPRHKQASFSGVRSTAYRLATIAGQGGLISLVGFLNDNGSGTTVAWSWAFSLLALGFLGLSAYHAVFLPQAENKNVQTVLAPISFFKVFASFFAKPGIGTTIAFLLLFRFAEAQALKLAAPFLLDSHADGGLGLTNAEVGLAYGTVGVTALTIGGLFGGVAVTRYGLARMWWPMVWAIHLPNAAFLALACLQPQSLLWVSIGLAVEQFGYGFGFTAYVLFMMRAADGPQRTAHYAICSGFMALGMMLPALPSGWLQSQLGYVGFFSWICAATILSFLVSAAARPNDDYGKRPS